MAYLDDQLNEDERQKAEGASMPGGGGGGAPASSGGPSRAPVSSGFQNLSSYFTANADQAGAQGSALASGLETQANDALRSDDPGQAMQTFGQLDAAATPGGLSTILQQDAGPNYTSGMAGLDSYLGTRGANPGAFENLRSMFGDRLKKVETRPESTPGARPTAPGAAPERSAFEDDVAFQRAMAAHNAAIRDYEQAAAAYAPGASEYEAWAQRRAENTGDEYAPEYAPPDAAPARQYPAWNPNDAGDREDEDSVTRRVR